MKLIAVIVAIGVACCAATIDTFQVSIIPPNQLLPGSGNRVIPGLYGGAYVLFPSMTNEDLSIQGAGLLNVSSSGEISFNNMYNVTSNNVWIGGITTDSAGSFYLVGGLSNDGLIVKLDSDGHMIWAKSQSNNDIFIWYNDVVLTEQQEIIVLGNGLATNGYVGVITKFNSDGDLMFTKYFSKDNVDSEWQALVKSDGYLAVGWTANYTGTWKGSDCMVIKFNDTGYMVWQMSFGTTSDDEVNNGGTAAVRNNVMACNSTE